jgi:Transglutaminase-like superfamily
MSGESRFSRLRAVVSGPSEALLAVRMLLWATLLPGLKRILPLPRLVSLMAPGHRGAPDEKRAAAVVTLARWVYKTGALRDNCLERSLITYRYLPSGNDESRLVLGVRKGDDGPPGHAWLTLGGVAVHDTDETLDKLVPVVAFDLDGNRCPVPEAVSPAPPAALA